MTKKGEVKIYDSSNKKSLSYKLQQLSSERRKLTAQLIRLCPQPLVTWLYATMFYDEMIIVPTVLFVIQMMIIIFDTPSCIRRSIKLKAIKEEVVEYLNKYEPIEAEVEAKKLIKRI